MSTSNYLLVSGGSGGIGAAVCTIAAERGFIPVVGYRNGSASAKTVAKRTGGMALPLDLCDAQSINAAVSVLAARDEPLVGVVLAASPPPTIAAFSKITVEDLDLQLQVNVTGPQRLLSGLVQACFRPNKRGSVVAVLTKAMGEEGWGANPHMGAYVIAKHGLQGVLAALAADYPWLNTNFVKPGYTETPMLEAFGHRFLEIQREMAPFQTAEQVALRIVDKIMGSSSRLD